MHAFVDESGRRGLILCVAKVVPRDAPHVRRALRDLLKPRQQRLHMTKESAPRQRLILSRLCDQPISANIYRSSFRVQRDGRSEIMRHIVEDTAIDRLTIESAVGQDVHDARALQDAAHRLGRSADFHYEHRAPRHEPLLWAADAIVFAYAVGGELRRRCELLITDITTVGPNA